MGELARNPALAKYESVPEIPGEPAPDNCPASAARNEPAENIPSDLQNTLDRIAKGEAFPSRNDGSIFQNKEGLLPSQPSGYYREYVHPTPGMSGPGAQRVIIGEGGEVYYTPNHYKAFIQVK
jgi:guanyl-specific ribonuclease Sa